MLYMSIVSVHNLFSLAWQRYGNFLNENSFYDKIVLYTEWQCNLALCESDLCVRFTLVTLNSREISTVIKVFRIVFTSFDKKKKQEYPFFAKLYFNHL